MKGIVNSLIQFFLIFLTKHPTIRRYCSTLSRGAGWHDFLHKINHQFQPDNIYSPRVPYKFNKIALSPRELSIYNEIKRITKDKKTVISDLNPNNKKRLAYVSPLPSQRSGISDYSASLLPLLSEHYDIEVIVNQDTISDAWIKENCPIRSAHWLKTHSSMYDRVIYHFGNSPFHEYMFDLLADVPGLVVLHDFFLGHIAHKRYAGSFGAYVYHSHGYNCADVLQHSNDPESIIWPYPLNFHVLQHALNVIVHSPYSQRLAKQFYGDDVANNWPVIPLLRLPPRSLDRNQSRITLNISTDAFVVCSFGLTGPIKLSHRLLDAWLSSDLAHDPHCMLFFVGENDAGDYGKDLLTRIKESGLSDRIHITDWIDEDTFHHYLSAADVGVQLRTRSRGETSAAVLDCMNYGLATIVNGNGSMVDLPRDAVHMLTDDFDDSELINALEALWQDGSYRQRIATKAQAVLNILHAPKSCANQYITAIESAYCSRQTGIQPLLETLGHLSEVGRTETGLRELAQAVAQANPPLFRQKQLLIDISAIVINDLKTGVQRVVRAQLEILLRHPPKGYRVEPVFLAYQGGQWRYQYARNWTIQFMGISDVMKSDDSAVEFNRDDILFCADLNSGVVVDAEHNHLYLKLMSAGVKVFFQVFDLLPISHPEWFPSEAEEKHMDWARVVANSSGAICISNAVADEFNALCRSNKDFNLPPEQVKFFHLGADIDTSSPSIGMPDNANRVLGKLASSPSFLMVGTIEPRKGHAQTLAAFENLWQQGLDINLVIVGNPGWMIDDLLDKLNTHPENGQHLFWLKSISDEYLDKVYHACRCLIAASEGEGFGLPLIEAAQYQRPIIARDIAVFREVAGQHATYFNGLDSDILAHTISQWLDLSAKGESPESIDMPWLTWRESTKELIKVLGLELSDSMK